MFAELRSWAVMWFLGGAMILVSDSGAAMAGEKEECNQKATFLINCAHFIDWPPATFASSQAPLTIGIFGENPFGNSLEALTRNTTIRGRNVQIVYTHSLAEAAECHLLFIGEETRQIPSVLGLLRGLSIVTVGETESFLEAGGMIALKSERRHVRLRINNNMVHEANVTMSSKLLRIAAQR